jgi:hypothetical protein
VRARVSAFVERTRADEVIVACSVFDHEKRKRSLGVTAEVLAIANQA